MINFKEILEKQQFIRNFCIIAHIDHGKSTLADRIIEKTQTVTLRNMKAQLLDSMDIERERGITIKLNAIELYYKSKDGNTYTFHLIDTPGHVDFAYEVSRSLAACEGAILVVDAAQGIEAQTLSNAYLAIDNDLALIPLINKIDLPSADIERVKHEIETVIGLDPADTILASAKQGIGIEELLEAIIIKVPCPTGDPSAPLQALIFDSHYDQFRGVIPLVRIVNGTIKKGDIIYMMSTNSNFEVTEVGIYSPIETKKDFLTTGDVGYVIANIRDIQFVRVGDTITSFTNKTTAPLPGYRVLNPMVYCGMFPVDNSKYNDLHDALDKLKLNDASLVYELETSQALGFGFRVGFLGMLHMDIIQERIEREFGLDLIATAPSVSYKVNLENNTQIVVDNPSRFPDSSKVKSIEEPFVKAFIMTPEEYVGSIMELCQNKRGIYSNLRYLDANRVEITYEIPLSEIIFDFFD